MSAKSISRRAGLAALAGAGFAWPAQGQAGRARQPEEPTPAGFMRLAERFRAEALAKGDQGYGAVVALDGVCVGEGVSAVVTANDPTAHAEMQAIRDACRRLGRRSLSGAILYSTFRPCPMCEAAATWAGVDRMIHGAGLSDAGRPRLSGNAPC